MMSNDGISNMANEMNAPYGALVLPLNGRTGSSGTNSWNGNLCCCFSTPVGGGGTDLQITAVDTGTEQLTITGHGLSNAAGPLLANAATTFPAPLTSATNYYAIVVDANTIKLATSQANALAGTAIDLTSAGSGVRSLAPNDADYIAGDTIGMIDRVIAAGYPVDTKKIFIYAQGGGGSAPAFRTACDYPGKIAAVFDYAGAGPVSADTTGGSDPPCDPSSKPATYGTNKVHFFHLHGTADISQEPYQGAVGSLNAGMPNKCPATLSSVPGTSTMQQLATFNGCDSGLALSSFGWEDMVSVGRSGNETDLYIAPNCPTTGTVILGSVSGEDHNFSGDAKNPNWKTRVYEYFLAHAKP